MNKSVFKFLTLLLLCFFANGLSAQKITEQTLEAWGIKQIFIQSNEVFRVHITTINTDKISLKTESEGIYAEDIGIHLARQNDKLFLTSAYQKILSSGYDKLSATKVFSLSVFLEIPEGMKVVVISNLASVFVDGSFDFLEAELKAGRCELKNFSGKAILNTYDGDIVIETEAATIEASSRNGVLNIAKNLPSGKKILAQTIDGDIIIKKL